VPAGAVRVAAAAAAAASPRPYAFWGGVSNGTQQTFGVEEQAGRGLGTWVRGCGVKRAGGLCFWVATAEKARFGMRGCSRETPCIGSHLRGVEV